jgi:helix-turn-helix protein
LNSLLFFNHLSCYDSLLWWAVTEETCFNNYNIANAIISCNTKKAQLLENIVLCYALGKTYEEFMELREYLFKNRITEEQFAKMLGISRGHVSCIKRGTQPSRLLAKEIERATEYNVLTEDLRPKDKKESPNVKIA